MPAAFIEIERLSKHLSGARMFRAQADGNEPELYSRLVANELDPMLARAVAQGTPLEQTFEVDPALGRQGAKRAVIALVGPPGVGKTTWPEMAMVCCEVRFDPQ